MRWPYPQQRGFALPLVLTTSALLLLSSLSLQTLALHARQRSSQALLHRISTAAQDPNLVRNQVALTDPQPRRGATGEAHKNHQIGGQL